MSATHEVSVDPETDEVTLNIIRDTTGKFKDKNWLNRYCEDDKSKVLPISLLKLNLILRKSYTTANMKRTINLFSIVEKGQVL